MGGLISLMIPAWSRRCWSSWLLGCSGWVALALAAVVLAVAFQGIDNHVVFLVEMAGDHLVVHITP